VNFDSLLTKCPETVDHYTCRVVYSLNRVSIIGVQDQLLPLSTPLRIMNYMVCPSLVCRINFCLPSWRDHEYKAFQEYISEARLSYEYLGFSLFSGHAVVRIIVP
jgi:hypothetical protein